MPVKNLIKIFTSADLFLRYLLLFCLSVLSFSFVLQYHFHLHPCLLCTLARSVMVFISITLCIAIWQYPYKQFFWIGINLLLACIGVGVTSRHLWLLHLPPELAPACGPTPDYWLRNFPLLDALWQILQSSGECAKEYTFFLGLPLPAWALGAFILLIAGNIWFGYLLRSSRS